MEDGWQSSISIRSSPTYLTSLMAHDLRSKQLLRDDFVFPHDRGIPRLFFFSRFYFRLRHCYYYYDDGAESVPTIPTEKIPKNPFQFFATGTRYSRLGLTAGLRLTLGPPAWGFLLLDIDRFGKKIAGHLLFVTSLARSLTYLVVVRGGEGKDGKENFMTRRVCGWTDSFVGMLEGVVLLLREDGVGEVDTLGTLVGCELQNYFG